MDVSTLEYALDFFFPFFSKECYIHFYGGEPFLAFDQIRHAVNYIQHMNKEGKKKIRYTISTNGSLINKKILKFLNHNKFIVSLSFDGFAQDLTKNKDSFGQIVCDIKELLKAPHIDLETNSVFTQETLGHLSKSIQFTSELGVPNISYTVSRIIPWESSSLTRLKKELESVRANLLSFYERIGSIPVVDFKEDSEKGIFTCDAGKERMVLMPDGRLWGCSLFAEYFKEKEGTSEYFKYCFGHLNSFVENYAIVYPEILSNYSNLRMDRCFTSDIRCIECSDLGECGVCPVDNLFSGSNIRKVAAWTCKIKKIFREEKKLFWKELEDQG